MNDASPLAKRIDSFRHALAGIGEVVKSQTNARIHLAATGLVVLAGLYFQLSLSEWSWIVLAIAAVWTAEAFNTAIEKLGDAVTKELHPQIKQAKDIAAGAVLLAALASLVIGLLVLGPHFLEWICATN